MNPSIDVERYAQASTLTALALSLSDGSSAAVTTNRLNDLAHASVRTSKLPPFQILNGIASTSQIENNVSERPTGDRKATRMFWFTIAAVRQIRDITNGR